MGIAYSDIPVRGSLLQPVWRRTSDIVRLALSISVLAAVVAGSLVTRSQWEDLGAAVSNIVGVLTPRQSQLVYTVYGVAILALPFMILAELIAGRRWKLLLGYGAAAVVSGLLLSITGDGLTTPSWRLGAPHRLQPFLTQFLDDPRWIAMLAAVLTVSGPWLPVHWRRWWWVLLLSFVPIHLVVSATVPARSALGLSAGWMVGAGIILVIGTPAAEVPLEAVVEVLARQGVAVSGFTVVQPAGSGPLVLAVDGPESPSEVIVELYGHNQRSRGALGSLIRWILFPGGDVNPPRVFMRDAVEHRALMAIVIADLGLAGPSFPTVAALERNWHMYAHSAPPGRLLDAPAGPAELTAVWKSLRALHDKRIAHGDLRRTEIRIDGGQALFDGFMFAQFGASDAQLESDIAQLLLTTGAICGAAEAVRGAIDAFGADAVLTASRRLTPSALPARVRKSVTQSGTMLTALRTAVTEHVGRDIILMKAARFSPIQIVQLVFVIGLAYIALPLVNSMPTFIAQLREANWWWVLLGLFASSLTYVGAATALWASISGRLGLRLLTVTQVANTFAAATTPAGLGGLALSARVLQRGGLSASRSAAAVALQQSVQILTHITLLIVFGAVAGTSTDWSRFVPSTTVLYLGAGVVAGCAGAVFGIPTLRRWLRETVSPQLTDAVGHLRMLAHDRRMFGLICLGCAATTLGAAATLWASVEAFGGHAAFVSVTVTTMVGGTIASAAPTPGGVGAVEAALIGGLAVFGLPVDTAVAAVLLYRVLTCWLPALLGWPTLRWLTRRGLI